MRDVTTINQALNDMKEHYGLKDIKHVTLNMEDAEDVYITFVSNAPNILKDKKWSPSAIKYKLNLSIMIDSVFPEE